VRGSRADEGRKTTGSAGCTKTRFKALCKKSTPLELAEKLLEDGKKCQGTTLVVPQVLQN
jgi:hypothetical protein